MQSAANSHSSGALRLKLVVAVVASLYFFWRAYDPQQWHLIDGVNLVIHEAGHLIFSPLGEFMMIAGGSLFQVIMPALFMGYFWYHGKYYSALLVLFGWAKAFSMFPFTQETRLICNRHFAGKEESKTMKGRPMMVALLIVKK